MSNRLVLSSCPPTRWKAFYILPTRRLGPRLDGACDCLTHSFHNTRKVVDTAIVWFVTSLDALVLQGGFHETIHAAFGQPEVLRAANFADVEVGIPDPANACQSLSNTDAIAGKIAIVIRGGCEFAQKVMSAQDAGAVGAIIYNFNPSGLAEAEMRGYSPMVMIPSVFIDGAYGELLVAAVEQGTTTVSLHCESPFVEHPGCVSCTPGQYDHDSSPATECILCPKDTFSNKTGATTCESCPAGLFSAAGSQTVEACNAAESTYLGCYKDGPQQWDTIVVDTMGDIDFATESRDTCNFICSDYKYMGLTWSTQCRWYIHATLA
eukprot:COSAG02_NODE_710_length_18178_cov_14.361524_13_plen_322_part_00